MLYSSQAKYSYKIKKSSIKIKHNYLKTFYFFAILCLQGLEEHFKLYTEQNSNYLYILVTS